MATYHHAFQIDRAGYFHALSEFLRVDTAERDQLISDRAAQIAEKFDPNNFLVAIRQDPEWFCEDANELGLGPLLLVHAVPFLTPAPSLTIDGTSAALVTSNDKSQRKELRDAIRACVLGDPITNFYEGTPWLEAVKSERFFNQYCGWLSATRCEFLLTTLCSDERAMAEVLGAVQQALEFGSGMGTDALLLVLET